MRLSRLFLIVTLFTMFLIALQLFGYPVVEFIAVMLLVNFLTLAASMYLSNENSKVEKEDDLKPRLETIEKKCTEILDKMNNSTLELKLEKHDENIAYLLDRMARKTSDLEERILKFGNGMVDSLSSLKNKVNTMENGKDGESFSLGELVYVKEDKDS